MSTDPFDQLIARHPLTIPQAAEHYENLPMKFLNATKEETVIAVAKNITKSSSDLRLRSLLPSGNGILVGAATKLMKENKNDIVKATGHLFDIGANINAVRTMALANNPVGIAIVLGYNIYSSTDEIIRLIDEYNEDRLRIKYDVMLDHWSTVARLNRKMMTKLCEYFDDFINKGELGWGKMAHSGFIRANSSTHRPETLYETQQTKTLYKFARRMQIKSLLGMAKEAHEYQQLSVTLNMAFSIASSDPNNNELLKAPPGYIGKIDENRHKIFSIYGAWFRDFDNKFTRYKIYFENIAVLYAWMAPEEAL